MSEINLSLIITYTNNHRFQLSAGNRWKNGKIKTLLRTNPVRHKHKLVKSYKM